MPNNISFRADKVRVTGPKIDGSYSITFEAGQYEQSKVSEMVAIPQDTMITVTVEVANG